MFGKTGGTETLAANIAVEWDDSWHGIKGGPILAVQNFRDRRSISRLAALIDP